MAYEDAGVRLIADGAAAYLNTLEKIEAAHDTLVSGARALADGINRIDDVFAAAAKKLQQFGERGDNAAKAARDLADAEGDTATAAAKMASATDKADDKTGDLEKAAEQAAAGVDDLGDAARKASDPIADTGKAAEQAGDEADDLDDKSRKGGKGLNFLGEAATGAVRKLGELAVEGLQEVAQAAADFAVDTVKAAGDFEGNMLQFAAVTGDSLDESGQSLEQFRDLFISLGRDLPVSTAEVQQAAIEMAKGGIEPATIAAGGLRTALDLAGASGVGIAQSAEILAKQLGVWVDKAADAGVKSAFLAQTADLLSQAANASVVNVDDLALGLANVGGSAKVAGVSFQETVTALALIAPGFSSASDAGTSMKTMLARLQPTTDKAAAAMKDLGLLTGEGLSKFYDSEGAFIGMEQAAGLLQSSLKKLSPAQKEMALNTIFGSDAIRAAAFLADAGSEGYRRMAEDMLKVGSVAQQAAARQQGFNVALDNVMGSLEAFQLTVGGALLPTLTNFLGLLASGINNITDYAAATIEGKTALADAATLIQSAALPALYGLTTALTTYAVVQAIQATPAILASLPAIAAQTAAFTANAAAVGLALLPYAAIAVSIGLVTAKWQQLSDQIDQQNQAMLESKPFWQASTQALDTFGATSGATKDRLSSLAGTIQVLRDQIAEETRIMAVRQLAGDLTEEQYAQEIAKVNEKAAALQVATGAYEAESQAIAAEQQAMIDAQAAAATATGVTRDQAAALNDLGGQASLTAQDIETLTKAIEKNAQEGQEAVMAYATTESEFLSGVEQRRQEHQAKLLELQQQGNADAIQAEKDSYAAQEQTAAASYAAQQAAQQQHLGQMLIDYTLAQSQLGNISKDKAIELIQGLEQAYGLQESSIASTYLRMTQTIDTYASDQSGSVSGVITTLQEQQQQAADTKKAMDEYATEYVAEAVANFVEKGQEADEYAAALRDIPTKVDTRLDSNAAVQQRMIEEFTRHLDAIPRNIHIEIDADIPDVITPGSPTPLEIGLYGIADAFKAVGDIAKLTGDKLKEAFAGVAESFSWAAAIPRAQEDMDAFIRGLTSMEGLDSTFLFQGGAADIHLLGSDTMAQFQQALADAEKLRALGPEGAAQADRFLQERIDQIQELAQLQRDLLLATDDTKRKEIETSIARVTSAQQNELMALLAAIPGIEEFLRQIQGRAVGGSVSAGRPYMVGEQGRPELFIPGQSGTIVPEGRIVQALASLAQIAAWNGGGQGQTTYNQQRTINMPVYTNNTPAAIPQAAEIAWSMLP